MSAKKSSIWKKLLIGLGILFGLFVAAAVIIPLVVDVDKYRPQIVEVAHEHINGKLELGKLSLSLWFQIKVNVDGFSLSDNDGNKIVSVKDVFFHVPFLPILSGSPVITFKMSQPELSVIKDKKGKLNVMSLMKAKKAPVGEVSKETEIVEGAPEESKPLSLPSIVMKARLGVEMLEAKLAYVDKSLDLVSKVEDLNVRLEDISLTETMKMAVWANLDTTFGKSLSVKGPVRLDGNMAPTFEGTKFISATLGLEADASELSIKMGDLFEKKTGVVAKMAADIALDTQMAKINKCDLSFHNAVISVGGTVSGFDKMATGGELSHDIKLTSNEISLQPWSELVPMLNDFKLAGSVLFGAESKGVVTDPQYKADLAAKKITAEAPMLKAKPEINAVVNVVTDQVKKMSMTMKAPGNDLKIVGNLVSFTKPKFNFQVTSSGMDLDQLIVLPEPEKSAASAAKGAPAEVASSSKGSAAKEEEKNLDAKLDPLRENEMAAVASGKIGFNLKFVKYFDITMSQMNGQLSLNKLVASLDRFGMQLWDGKISASGNANLRPKTPTYTFNSEVASLNIQKAVKSKLELFKNTLLGSLYFKMGGKGSSFNPEPAKRNLAAKGNMKVLNGTIATIDVTNVVVKAVNDSVGRLQGQIPQLRGKNVKPPSNQQSTYDSITSNFSIAGGKFSAPDFFAKAKKNQGVDVKGNTNVGLIDYALKADWELIDTYNLTKARDLSVTQSGVHVPHIFARGNEPVRFPVQVGGTVFSPAVNYGSVPVALAKVATDNIGRAIGAKAKAEAQKRIQAEAKKLTKKAPVQKILKQLPKQLPKLPF